MLKSKLLTIGFAATIAGFLQLGSIGPAQSGAVLAIGTSGADRTVADSQNADVIKVGRRHKARRHKARRHRAHRRHRVRHRRVHRRHYRRHSGYSYRRHRSRRSRIHIGIGVPYYGYRAPYYGYGYGYGYPYVGAVVAPRVVHRHTHARRSCRSLGVGSSAWARCCSSKYKSFNRRTGLYLAYSGRYRACR